MYVYSAYKYSKPKERKLNEIITVHSKMLFDCQSQGEIILPQHHVFVLDPARGLSPHEMQHCSSSGNGGEKPSGVPDPALTILHTYVTTRQFRSL